MFWSLSCAFRFSSVLAASYVAIFFEVIITEEDNPCYQAANSSIMLRTDCVAKLPCWFLVAQRSEGLWQLMPGVWLYCIDLVVFPYCISGLCYVVIQEQPYFARLDIVFLSGEPI